VVYKGITSYSKLMELRNLRKVLYKKKCNWEIQIKKKVESFEEEGEEETLHVVPQHRAE